MSSTLLLLLFLAGDLDAAEQALREGRPQVALELLDDLAEGEEAGARAWLVEGRAFFALRDYRSAVEPLVRASDARPGDQEIAREAALACWYAADGPYARLYLEDARRMAVRAGDQQLLAALDFAAADFEAALKRYRALEPTDATRLPVLMRIADCLGRLGHDDEAREAYARALEEALRVEELATAYRAAFAARRGGRLLSWLDEKVAAQPERLDYRLYRGYARTEALMYEEAIGDLRFVAERLPARTDVKERLSFVLLQHGVRAQDEAAVYEAEALAQAVLDAQPGHRRAWERLAWLGGRYWANGDVERSYAVLKDLNRRDPEDLSAGLNFGAMARRLGRYAEAQAAYDRLLEVSPDDPAVLNDYAILVDGMGDRPRAVGLWEKTLAEEPDNLNALENLFTHHWERGHREEMERYLERGHEAAKRRGGLLGRWRWFSDRLRWAPQGFGE